MSERLRIMNLVRLISVLIMIVVFAFVTANPAAAQDENVQPMTDEQKMEEVRGYFESEYQEEDYFRADRLLMTATGSMKPVYKAPSVASVITAEDIEKIGAMTLDEVLETVPGLHVIPSSWNRLNSIFSIRGIHTGENPEVLLMLNSIPITFNLTGSRPNLFNMSVANISRIEVIRGPGSAVHGADAFAGTINIITKDGQEIDGVSTGIRAGSFDTYDVWFQHGANYGGWDVAVSLDYLTSDGDNDRIIKADLQTTLDAVLGTDASLAPGPLNTNNEILDAHLGLAKDNWTLRLWGWQQNDGGNGAGVAQILDPVGNENGDLFLSDVNYRNTELISDWDLNLRLSYMYYRQESYIKIAPDDALVPIGEDGNIDFVNPAGMTYFPDGVIGYPKGTSNTVMMDFTSFYDGFNQHHLRFGVGFKYLDLEAEESKNFGPGVLDGTQTEQDGTLTDVTGTPYIFIKDVDRDIWHVLFQDVWSLAKKWELTAGIRYDHYSDFGGTTNPRLALVWETRPDLTTKLLYGRAFRPPAFNENHMINNPLSLGNPDLDPETIDTVELAFDFQPVNTLRTKFNVFAYDIDGLIEHVPDEGQTTATAQNARDQEGYGFELEADWQMTRTFQLMGNVAYQHSEDKGTNDTVPYAPQWQFYLNGHWDFLPDWSLDCQYYWIGDRHREPDDPRSDIDDYSLVNLTLRRKNIADHWDFAVLVKNLFDEDAREPSQVSIPDDYPMEERSVFGEVRVHF